MTAQRIYLPYFSADELTDGEVLAVGHTLAATPYTELDLVARSDVRDRVRRACLAGLSADHRLAFVQIGSLSAFARAVRLRYHILQDSTQQKAPPEGEA